MISIISLDQKFDSEKSYHKPRSFNEISEIIDYSDTGIIYDYP